MRRERASFAGAQSESGAQVPLGAVRAHLGEPQAGRHHRRGRALRRA